MAGQVDIKDLINPNVKKGLEDITNQLQKVIDTIAKLTDGAVKLKESFDKGAGSQKNLSDNINKVNTATNSLSKSEQEILKIEKQTLDLQAKIIAEESKQNKKLQELKATRSELNKEIKANIKEQQNEIKYGKIAEDSITRKRQKLKDLTTAYDRGSEALRRELTPQIQKLSKEITKAEETTGRHQRGVGNYGKAWQGLKSMILPVFASLTAGISTIKLVKGAIDSIQSTSDKWGRTLSGLKVGVNAFMRSLASGDFSNFLSTMQEAVKVGREYYNILDDIYDINNSIKIQEADARRFILERMVILRDELSTNEQRIKAADEIIAKEDELAAKKAKSAKKELDAELQLASFKASASQEDILNYLRNYDQTEDLRKQADDYNALLEKRNKLTQSQKNVSALSYTYTTQSQIAKATGDYADRLKDIESLIASTNPEIVKWANTQNSLNQLNDEQRTKIVELYTAWKDAENSALENTQRVLSRRSTLLDENNRNEEKVQKERTDFITKYNKETDKEFTSFIKKEGEDFLKQVEAQNDAIYEDSKALTERLLNNKKAEYDRELELLREVEEEKKNIRQDSANQSFEFIQVLNDRQTANIEAQKEFELELAGDNAGEREKIEKKYDAERRKIQRRQAIIDKGQAIFNAILNGREAFTKALTKDPTGILASFTAILTGLQLATIVATPIPKFKKGTKYSPEGLAIVGEAGQELIEYPSGYKALTPDTATMTYLPKGSKVHTAAETKAIKTSLTDEKLDILIAETKQANRKKTVINSTTITDEGIKRMTKEANNFTHWQDTYFRK